MRISDWSSDVCSADLNGDPAEDEWREAVREAAGAPRPDVQLDPHAPALISYTRGTTGQPQGAVHSQHNVAVVPAALVCRQDSSEERRVGKEGVRPCRTRWSPSH